LQISETRKEKGQRSGKKKKWGESWLGAKVSNRHEEPRRKNRTGWRIKEWGTRKGASAQRGTCIDSEKLVGVMNTMM